jgi:hypothetical protein
MPRAAVPLTILALALAGCGDDGNGDGDGSGGGGSGKSGGQLGPPQDELQRNTYDAAKEVCSEYPAEETARQLGLPSSASDDEIADAYAKDASTPDQQPFSFDGCIAGLAEAPGR